MKSAAILLILVLAYTAASAATYTWEDANGLNFTDNASSIPERYRTRPIPESSKQPVVLHAQARPGTGPQDGLAAVRETQAADHAANLEQHRQSAEAEKQKQVHARDFENTLQSLAMYVVIWVLLGVFLFVVWVATIADIVRSEFMAPSGKTVWLLVVIFVPLLGMLCYLMLGACQKCASVRNVPRKSAAA